MKLITTLLFYFFINSIHLSAHELWLEAKEYNLHRDDKIIINIKVGQDLVGESYPFLNHETEKLLLQSSTILKPLKQNDGDYPAIQQIPDEKGMQYIYYQSNKEFLKYKDYKTFLEFVDEYHLTYNQKDKNIPKEIYQRFAKTIVKYDNSNFFKPNNNLEFEIINENDPFMNNDSQIKIFLNNKPFSNKTFIVFFRNDNVFEKKEYKTNKSGFAKINTSKKGLYLISAVNLETLNFIDQFRFKADYYSKWASLTFKKY